MDYALQQARDSETFCQSNLWHKKCIPFSSYFINLTCWQINLKYVIFLFDFILKLFIYIFMI